MATFNMGAIVGAAGSLRLGWTRTVTILTAALALGLRRTFVPLVRMRAVMRSLSTVTAMAAMLRLMLACRAAFLDRRFLLLFFYAEKSGNDLLDDATT
ncbi:MAG: hypothetical protein WB402_01620, partial [Sulfuricaulis sp.]|uniref:hypothetical protein n=1 Tax=Sulfuricaulis sp. TaxID=2003553 RepID=UPI003C6B4FF7